MELVDNLDEYIIQQGHKGNCWDNVPQESFFGDMKDEIDISECRKQREVKAVIDDRMDYYNSERYKKMSLTRGTVYREGIWI